MRIGVISDTHIPEKSAKVPDKILNDFKNMDLIIHAGDLGSVGVLEKLKEACPNITAVYGNMDPYELKKKLPEKEVIKVAGHSIGVTHGYGPAPNLINFLKDFFKNDKVDIIVFGHSHTAFNEKIGQILFFNPGSPTDTVFAPYNSYGVIEITDKIEAKIIKI